MADEPSGNTQDSADKDKRDSDYLQEIGYAPVAEALKKSPKDSVIAVYLRNASTIVRAQISEYLYEETEKRSRGITYNQVDKNRSGLILMTNQEISIDELASMCGKFGRVDGVHREYRVIDVTVQNSKIIKLDPSKSLDPDSPDFFRQQLASLRSIDPKVKMEAVKRLGRSQPKAMRDDIAKELMMMLPYSQVDLQLEIIKTLQVWSQPGDGAGHERTNSSPSQWSFKTGVSGTRTSKFCIIWRSCSRLWQCIRKVPGRLPKATAILTVSFGYTSTVSRQ